MSVPPPGEDARILVTGASGFLGSHLLRALIARSPRLQIHAAVRRGTDLARIAAIRDCVHIAAVDVVDAEELARVCSRARPTHVIHAAAYGVDWSRRDPDTALAVNVLGTLATLRAAAAAGAGRFVHIGTASEYGDHAGPIGEHVVPHPREVYGATKAAATILVQERAAALGIHCVIARPFGLWGPLEAPHRLVPQVFAACRQRRALDLTDCEQIRDMSYVRDMARWIVGLTFAESVPTATIVNLGSGSAVRLKDFVLDIAQRLGGDGLMRFGRLPRRPNEMPMMVPDVSRAQHLLGPLGRTPLAVAVEELIGCESAAS